MFQDGGTESCYRSVLRFERVQRSHSGEWMLLVRSSKGVADASLALNVTLASGYSSGQRSNVPFLERIFGCLLLATILRPLA